MIREQKFPYEHVYVSATGWLIIMTEGRAAPLFRLTPEQQQEWNFLRKEPVTLL